MQRFILILMGLFVFLAAGCNGIQVVDNTYDSIGGKKFHVVEDYEYKGIVDAYSKSNCPSCSAGNQVSALKVRSDLFVKADENKKVQGFAFIERRNSGSRYYWLPEKGPRCELSGFPYVEQFFFSDGSDNYSQYYVGYLTNSGYDLTLKEGVTCIALRRNFTKTTKGVLAQCIDTEQLPKDLSQGELEEYLRNEIRKTFTQVD
ncbi:hypothetical protein [Salidesulfovibrio onnuriiensis]|uniref:hypothetical protein n=1 Tax=Salidesulfovibrio onnuriiensis TaxID=2583823 RepID=UPI0011C8C060|nr:hypothetical protein [Salidesulfovibrio onnuriiensis]